MGNDEMKNTDMMIFMTDPSSLVFDAFATGES